MNFFSKSKSHDDADEHKLLSAYRDSGELAVLGKLYEKYIPLVYGVCIKYLKDTEQAKDAVMGIFEELVTKARQHDIKQFKSWLYVVSRNYCLMQLRAEKKAGFINIDDFVEFAPVLHHDDGADKEAVVRSLERCIEKLADNQKQAVSLFYLKEKCYREITEITGFGLNEVKSYIQNGKRNLKICMERSNA
jgi:RNA polymerase sigma-70 factor (ECF subfamily)